MDDTLNASATPDEPLFDDAVEDDFGPLDNTTETTDKPLEDITGNTRRAAIEEAFKKAETITDKPEQPAPLTQQPAQVEPAKQIAAPQSWKEDVKAQFSTLPESVRNEVMRREAEINQRLTETKQERQIATNFIEATQKYMPALKQAGLNPFVATQQALELTTALHTGSPEVKAKLITDLIMKNKIDLGQLDELLANATTAPQPAAIDPELKQRIDRLEQFYQQTTQEKQTQAATEINRTIETFANDSKNKYFAAVQQDMLQLLRSGVVGDPKNVPNSEAFTKMLADAYDKACWANPEIRKQIINEQNMNKQRLGASNGTLTNTGPRGKAGLAALENKKKLSRRELLSHYWPNEE